MKEDIKLILKYVRDFLSKRLLIIICVSLFFVYALFSILLNPKQYQSNTSFIAQLSNNSNTGSGLKNIADLIGVNIGGSKEQKDIPLYLYPKLMSSLDYHRDLLSTKVTIKKDTTGITLKDYYLQHKKTPFTKTIKKYTIGLPGLIVKNLKSKEGGQGGKRLDSLTYIDPIELKIIDLLSEDIVYAVNDVDGSISISATMDEPVLSAQVAERAKQLLQDKIIEYRLGRAQERYDFIDKQYVEKKEEYNKARSSLAYYVDKNRFNNTQTSLLTRKKLENEANLAYAIYSELESQRLREQINIKEDTPVFTTIQNAVVPLKEVGAGPIFVLIKNIIFGFIFAVGIYFFLILWKEFKLLWKTTKKEY